MATVFLAHDVKHDRPVALKLLHPELAAARPPRLVARLDDPARPSYRADFTTDGRRIYFTVNDRQSDISVVELIAP